MRILITGAAGFIGSHAAERLKASGHDVTGIDNFSPYYDVSIKERNAGELKNNGIRVDRLDLRTDDLDALLSDSFDYIFHFSAQPGIAASSTFDDYLSNNVIATQRLLTAIEQLKHKPFFVNISTSSVYGLNATMAEDEAPMPASWYGVTKLAAEQLVLAYTRRKLLKGTSMRLYSVFGPRERPDKLYPRLIDCGLNDKPFPLYRGSEKHLRSFTYIEDIIDGIVSVIGKEEVANGEIFNLGTEEENSTADGISAVEELLGKKIGIEIQEPRPGDQHRTCANIDKARKLLGYDPQTSLKEGLKSHIAWFRKQLS